MGRCLLVAVTKLQAKFGRLPRVNKTGLIAKISIKYVLPTCIWKFFWRISRYFAFLGEFRRILRKYLNFAGPQPRELSEALGGAGRFGKLCILLEKSWLCPWKPCQAFVSVLHRGVSGTQRQKFHTDDEKSDRNPVNSADWSTDGILGIVYEWQTKDKRPQKSNVNAKNL